MARADTAAMLAAMEKEPERVWSREELHQLRGGMGPVDATGQALTKLANARTIERAGRGKYRWLGKSGKAIAAAPRTATREAVAPKTKAKPDAAPTTTAMPAASAGLRARVKWLVEGHRQGFLTTEALLDAILLAVGEEPPAVDAA